VQGWVPVNPRNFSSIAVCWADLFRSDGHDRHRPLLLITSLQTAGVTLIWLAMRGAPLI
jgi:hypothetical protein